MGFGRLNFLVMTGSLPEPFVDRLEKIVPPEKYDEVISSFSQQRHVSFRINRLKSNPDLVLSELDRLNIPLQPLQWRKCSFWTPSEFKETLSRSLPAVESHIYIQNPSSMLAADLLEACSEETILDMAAAPGSKTTLLADAMNNTGRLSAIEPVKDRFFRLRANLERMGVSCVRTYRMDGTLAGVKKPEFFDRVLLDAPCSSEGQFLAHAPRTFHYWSEKKIKEMARKQFRLLVSAFRALKPKGVMVYSTCTFAPEENEAVVSKLLKRYPDSVEVIPIEVPIENTQAGLLRWGKREFDSQLRLARRILPNDLFEGFFVCKLQKLA
ncbi:MAG: RsmB/NOP family class I SAM-dependent RNA methyltransferase [Gammaproteobacteria bacterium]|nr:RsmB/NOP family class I SAM-dependent RNA methyltransferase [Gammaproteobacteria bacterium]MDH5693524.1 RsmB/NOP family class I SAM-dependent RNA methyltransferase [Gammaproteobacteria bacterium]